MNSFRRIKAHIVYTITCIGIGNIKDWRKSTFKQVRVKYQYCILNLLHSNLIWLPFFFWNKMNTETKVKELQVIRKHFQLCCSKKQYPIWTLVPENWIGNFRFVSLRKIKRKTDYQTSLQLCFYKLRFTQCLVLKLVKK